MAQQIVEVHAESAASPDAVWGLLADVTTWTEWTAFDEASYERTGTPTPHGVGAVRAFRVGRLRSKDTVLDFEPPTRLSYTYEGWLPIKDYRADVKLSPYGSGTRITWRSEFRSKIPFAGPLLRRVVAKVLQDIASRLAQAASAPTSSTL